jgi:hypothetical protein
MMDDPAPGFPRLRLHHCIMFGGTHGENIAVLGYTFQSPASTAGRSSASSSRACAHSRSIQRSL